MVTHKEIKEQIDELDILQTLTRSSAEIASSRMRQTRNYVLKNRTFLNSISDIFQEVRIAYARQLYKLMSARGKKGQRVTLLSHNGKTVHVFLSANTGLYGD